MASRNKLKLLKWDSIFISVLSIAIGILCIAVPDQSRKVLCEIFGIILIVVGAVFLINAAVKHKLFSGYVLLVSVVLILLGIYVLVKPNTVFDLLTALLGIYLVVDSTQGFVDSVDYYGRNVKGWWVLMLASLVTAGLGIALMFASFESIMIFAGCSLLVGGLSKLIITLVFFSKR